MPSKKEPFNRNFYRLDLKRCVKLLKKTARAGAKVVYINDFPIKGAQAPYAVFHVDKPNKTLGHFEYAAFIVTPLGVHVTGFNKTTIKKHSKVSGFRCLKCKSVIYSPGRHVSISCKCKNIVIDGGDAYMHFSSKAKIYLENVTIDLLSNDIVTDTIKE